MRDRFYDDLRDRLIRRQKEQEVYRESTQSLMFEKWFCRGYEAALDWVLEQAKEIHTLEELKALHPRK